MPYQCPLEGELHRELLQGPLEVPRLLQTPPGLGDLGVLHERVRHVSHHRPLHIPPGQVEPYEVCYGPHGAEALHAEVVGEPPGLIEQLPRPFTRACDVRARLDVRDDDLEPVAYEVPYRDHPLRHVGVRHAHIRYGERLDIRQGSIERHQLRGDGPSVLCARETHTHPPDMEVRGEPANEPVRLPVPVPHLGYHEPAVGRFGRHYGYLVHGEVLGSLPELAAYAWDTLSKEHLHAEVALSHSMM